MRVFKYSLSENLLSANDVVSMHGENPKVVHVGPDPGTGALCVWAEVDESQPLHTHDCLIRGTGHPSPGPEYRHIGSAICGSLVWHVYSRTLVRR